MVAILLFFPCHFHACFAFTRVLYVICDMSVSYMESYPLFGSVKKYKASIYHHLEERSAYCVDMDYLDLLISHTDVL